MSKLARVLALGVMLAAMNLAGMTAVAQEQTTADAALQRVLAQEHRYIGGTPAEVTSPVRPAEPSGQPGLLVVALGVLAAALALAAMTARRASRKVRPRQAA